MLLRNRKTGGWFELSDDKVYDSVKNKTPKQKAKQIDDYNNKEIYEKYNLYTTESDGLTEYPLKTISIKNENTGIYEGRLEYWENENKEIHIERTNVFKEYQRKGLATMMLKELQKRAGDNDIYFDTLTKDGEKLINKVASKKEIYKTGINNKPYYKGRIK